MADKSLTISGLSLNDVKILVREMVWYTDSIISHMTKKTGASTSLAEKLEGWHTLNLAMSHHHDMYSCLLGSICEIEKVPEGERDSPALRTLTLTFSENFFDSIVVGLNSPWLNLAKAQDIDSFWHQTKNDDDAAMLREAHETIVGAFRDAVVSAVADHSDPISETEDVVLHTMPPPKPWGAARVAVQ